MRSVASIKEIAARYTDLKLFPGKPDWYMGNCPLCDDDDGSFYVASDGSREGFECYDCGVKGDALDLEYLLSGDAALQGLGAESPNGSAESPSPNGKLPDGAELLEKLVAFIRRFVALSGEEAVITALWIVHTHSLGAADCTPYLSIVSAEKRSGKTRLLEVLSLLAARAWLTGRVTAAVLVRKTAAEQPSLLLDESDAAFKGDKEYSETLRAVLNSGFRRGGVASLCVGQGANITYEDFPVFCPKAIAGIGKLPDTISDRAIKIELKRRSRSEPVERFRLRKAEADAAALREWAGAWGVVHLERLRDLEPELPDELDDRAQDIVEPLLAIAEVVGGEWPERARKALIKLAGAESREDSESLGVRLLREIRDIFDEKKVGQLSTADLLAALHALEEAPWGSLRGEPLDARGLARFLKPYHIKPEKLREGDHTYRGYKRASFEDAWARYAPPTPGEAEHPEHPEHPADRAESDVPHKQNVPEHDGYTEHKTPHEQRDVPRVPHVPDNPGTGRENASLGSRRFTVEEAAGDPENHPISCGCEECL